MKLRKAFGALVLAFGICPRGHAALPQAVSGPVLSMLMTCARLTPTLYPADSTNWFDPLKDQQVVFTAHMLFPLMPEQVPLNLTPSVAVNDLHYAEAVWIDPDGAEAARYGLTMPARVSVDYLSLEGLPYSPHTFAMAAGINDLRPAAGQKLLLAKPGQYHIRLSVDGHLEGLVFFRILGSAKGSGASSPAVAPMSLTTPTQSFLLDMMRLLTSTATTTK